MKRTCITATLYTLITALVLGLGYPLLMLGIAQTFFREKADGQLLMQGNTLLGSRLIGQPFTGPGYFHSRPSLAGTGYDAANSSGSNLASTNQALITRIEQSVAQEIAPNHAAVPVDLVTASGSGLDPDITPAAAYYQAARIAQVRRLSAATVRTLIAQHTVGRQLGLLGEPHVPVLLLNRDLDALSHHQQASAQP